MLEENVLVSFLKKFDKYPFLVKIKGKEYLIGEGEPTFTVRFNKMIPLTELATSTSLALGEAYMNKDLEIEGDLYEALDHFLGQMGKFSRDDNALKKLMFTSTGKKNQQKEVQSHYDIGNDFYKLWLGISPDFHTLDVENLRLHYSRTLRCWDKKYQEHLDEVREMFDQRFVRMWDLYLASCAATFHNGIIDLHQILVSKGVNNDVPMVRWY